MAEQGDQPATHLAAAFLAGPGGNPGQIRQAQGHRTKDGVRYSSDDWAGPVSDVARPLAYLATEPEMLDAIFPDRAEKRRFKKELDDVLKRHDFWQEKDYKPSHAPKAY